MADPRPSPLPDLRAAPDFRQMSVQDLRDHMSALNTHIKDLKRQARENTEDMLTASSLAACHGMAAGGFFPSASAALILAQMKAQNRDGKPRGGDPFAIRSALRAATDLRRQFKDVWRARPGRPFYDLKSRFKREAARKYREGLGREARYMRDFPFNPTM